MPEISQMITALRDDADRFDLAPPHALRAAGQRRTVVRRATGALAALAVAAGTVAALIAPAHSGHRPAKPTPAESARYTVVTGVVMENGRPKAGAVVTVEVIVFPTGSDAHGTFLDTGSAATGPDGRYSMVLPPALVATTGANSGTAAAPRVSLVVDVSTVKMDGKWTVGAQACTPQPASARFWCAEGGATPLILDFDMGTTPKVRFDGTWHKLVIYGLY